MPASNKGLSFREILIIEAMKVAMTDTKLNSVSIALKAVRQADAVLSEVEKANAKSK